MSFFGITQVGYQNAVRQGAKRSDYTPQEWTDRKQPPGGTDITPLPPIKGLVKRERSIIPLNQTACYGPGPDKSHKEFVRLKRKHIRNPEEPLEIFRLPLTAAQEYGHWRRDEPVSQNLPWAKVHRRTHVNSEMTRFVHDMKLTNREFSLY